ncbi:hypothetical protein AGMMS49942_20980 [Spirochaetia bacterium]|nr:hypothetical protein AGMMS49942_20980 [Spirochaetia bacterium]
MDNEVVRLLGSGFCRLSGKNRAEILGMVTALAFTQAEPGQTATAPMNALTGALGSAVNRARSGFLVRGVRKAGDLKL